MANTAASRATLSKALNSVKGGIKAGSDAITNLMPAYVSTYKRAVPKPARVSPVNAKTLKNMNSVTKNAKVFGTPKK